MPSISRLPTTAWGESSQEFSGLGQAVCYRFKRDEQGLAGVRHHQP